MIKEGKDLKNLEKSSFLKIINENPHVGTLIYQNNEIIYANKKVSKITGYSIKEIEKMDIFDFLVAKDTGIAKKLINFFKNNIEKDHARIRIKKKDGSIIKVLVAVSCISLRSKQATLINIIEITKEGLYEDFQKLIEFSNRLLISENNEDDYIRKLIRELNNIYSTNYFSRVKAYCGRIENDHKIKLFCNTNTDTDIIYLNTFGNATAEKFKNNENCIGIIDKNKITIDRFENSKNKKVRFYLMPIKQNGKIKYTVIILSELNGFFENKDRNLLIGAFKKIIESSLKKLSKEKDIRILYKALENSPNWVVITDREGTILYGNKTVEKLSGYTLEEVLGKNPRIFKSGYHNKEFYKKLWKTITTGKTFECVMLNKRKDGKPFKMQYSIIPVQAKEEIKNFVAIGIDTSREEELEGEVFRLKFHDSSIGIYNRYGIKFKIHELVQEMKKGQIGIAGILDIANFSEINTIYSHDIGDQILVEVANVLKDNFPEAVIGRIGGDKFAIFKIIEQEQLFDFVNKFIPIFKSKKFSDIKLPIGVNVGISAFPNDAKDMEELLINANSALKIAKKRGRNNIKIFDIKISKDVEKISKKMELIINSYENDWFEIFLQPYFDVKNINLAGFESLLRIRHPEKGIIPPGFFINTLEKSELLFEIEKRTIQKVARIMEEWKKKSYIVKPVSINITAKSFAQSNTIEALKKYANGNMNIEIIERILVDNKDYTQKVLKELKKFNIKCFLDDFGTGYSSLSYITTMPIDTIKIDISFIRKFLEDKKTYAIVESIISLSKKLGMKTVAEGVENESQFKELKKLDCDTVQGYLFAKPVPYRQAEKWLKTE